jgi:hypothetical protein
MAMYNNSHSEPLRFQNTLGSIDKVSLWTSNFQVKPEATLTIQPRAFSLSDGPSETENPLFVDTDGRPIYGQKAFANSDRYNLTVERLEGSEFLSISFNPNKFAHYYQGTTDTDQMRHQISSVGHDLLENGIVLDFEGLKVKRLDLMKQRQLDEPLSSHRAVLSSLSAKRQTTRAYLDTFLIGNQQHQTTFYDKGVEAKVPNLPNLIRCEVRALRSRTVQRIYGIQTVSDLLTTDLETLTEGYNQHLKGSIFTHHQNPSENLASEIQKLEYYLQTYERSGVNHYLRNAGIEQVIRKFGSVEALVDTLQSLGLSRQKAHDWKRKLSVTYSEAIAFAKRSESETARLYDNLYSFAV